MPAYPTPRTYTMPDGSQQTFSSSEEKDDAFSRAKSSGYNVTANQGITNAQLGTIPNTSISSIDIPKPPTGTMPPVQGTALSKGIDLSKSYVPATIPNVYGNVPTNLTIDAKKYQQPELTPEQQRNAEVLKTAQEKVIQGFDSPVMGETSAKTLELLQNPNLNYRPELINQQAMENYDRNQANLLNAFRSQNADIMNAGVMRQQLLDAAVKGGIDRTMLERQNQIDASNQERLNLLTALSEGRSTAASEGQRFQTDIGGLTSVRGAAEGAETRASAATQNQFDRNFEVEKMNIKAELDKAFAQGDFAKAMILNDQMAQIDRDSQKAQQDWTTGERVATQGWQTGERIGTQDFQAAQTYLDRKLKIAQQEKDLNMQKYIEDQRANLSITLQTNEMNQQEKMAYLEGEIANAKADKDVGRQERLYQYQSNLKMNEAAQNYGFENALQQSRIDAETAIKQGDWAQAIALQKSQNEFIASEAVKNRAQEQLRIDLQEKGFAFDAIQQGVENGTIDPDAAAAMIQSAVTKYGITVQAPDPEAAKQRIIQAYQDSQTTWEQAYRASNTEYFTDGELNEKGRLAFAQYYQVNGLGEDPGSIATGVPTGSEAASPISGANATALGGNDVAFFDSVKNDWVRPSIGSYVKFTAPVNAPELGYGSLPAGTYKVENVTGQSGLVNLAGNFFVSGNKYYPADKRAASAAGESVLASKFGKDMVRKNADGSYTIL